MSFAAVYPFAESFSVCFGQGGEAQSAGHPCLIEPYKFAARRNGAAIFKE
jgi:hypothetical protein